MSEKEIDELIRGFDPNAEGEKAERRRTAPVTFWIPREAKDKFDRLQRASNFEFSRLLKKIIISSIEKVEE